jgi:hypothetical protein
MRFLLGLVTGVALTLAVAASIEGRTNELIDQARVLWSELRGTTKELLEAENLPAEAAPSLEPETLVTEEPPMERETFVTEEPPVEVEGPPAKVEGVSVYESEPEISTLDPTKLSDAGAGTESVWTAFHSERSANGFAEVLTRETGHEFSIDKRGPGEYHVIFAYADENEKAELLGLIASVTGSE